MYKEGEVKKKKGVGRVERWYKEEKEVVGRKSRRILIKEGEGIKKEEKEIVDKGRKRKRRKRKRMLMKER